MCLTLETRKYRVRGSYGRGDHQPPCRFEPACGNSRTGMPRCRACGDDVFPHHRSLWHGIGSTEHCLQQPAFVNGDRGSCHRSRLLCAYDFVKMNPRHRPLLWLVRLENKVLELEALERTDREKVRAGLYRRLMATLENDSRRRFRGLIGRRPLKEAVVKPQIYLGVLWGSAVQNLRSTLN